MTVFVWKFFSDNYEKLFFFGWVKLPLFQSNGKIIVFRKV